MYGHLLVISVPNSTLESAIFIQKSELYVWNFSGVIPRNLNILAGIQCLELASEHQSDVVKRFLKWYNFI